MWQKIKGLGTKYILLLPFLFLVGLTSCYAQTNKQKEKIKREIERFLPYSLICIDTEDGFIIESRDSCTYYMTISPTRNGYIEFRNKVKLYVKLDKKWSVQQVKNTQAFNDSLKNEIDCQPIPHIFADYRKWVPYKPCGLKGEMIIEKEKTPFLRMPYNSEKHKKLSVFIYDNRPGFFWTLQEDHIKYDFIAIKAIIVHRILLLEDYGSLYLENFYGF